MDIIRDYRFESMDAMLDMLDKRGAPSFALESDNYWAGGSYGSVRELAKTGWADHQPAVMDIANLLFNKISSKIERNDPCLALVGADIDIGAYCDGSPECMVMMQPTMVDGRGQRILSLAYNVSTSGDIDAASLTKKGSVAASLIYLLETVGYRVELWACFGAKRVNTQYQWRALVKQADQPLDMGRMLFAIAHPGMLRRLTFHMMDTEPTEVAQAIDARRSYGSPTEPSFKDKFDIYIGSSTYGQFDWNNPEPWIIERLKEQGVEVH